MAIFRGTGGSGNSTDDSIVDAVTEQAGIATTKASEAANSATSAASSASAASSSVTTASTKATEASTAKTDAETAETNAQTAQSAAETARDQAQASATSAATSANTANSTAVQTVASSNTQVVGVYNNIDNVNTVAGDITDVNTVAGISSNVTTVADDSSDIGTVASNIGNVNNVGNNISNVNSVAGNATNINTVASDGTDIGTVAGNISNVNTVAGISSNVTTVAGLETKLDTVIADATDIGTVAGNIGDVGTVAGISSDVTSVANNSTNINTVASDISAVQNASTNAANAATSASNASDSASSASTSASTATTKASEASASATSASNSATTATTKASQASTASSTATTKASEAAASATSASSSATTATTKASEASASAIGASGSASTASTKATEAAASATEIKSLTAATGAEGSSASYNSSTGVLTVPRGDTGATGAQGNNGSLTVDTVSGNLSFADNGKANFGAGDDLQIYHDGNHSWIRDLGTGDLILQGTQLRIRAGNNENHIYCTEDGAVQVYYNGVEKLATTSTGIDVTGTATANDVNITDTTPNLKFTDTDGNHLANLTQSGSHLYIDNDSTGDIRFRVDSNTERLTVNSTGINVTGTATMDGLTFGTNNRIQGTGMLFVGGSAATVFEVGAGAEKMRLTSTGLGIGTSSPSEPLHVQEGSSGITSKAGTIALIEGSGNTKVSIASGATSTGELLFGRSTDNDAGRIIYDHNDNSLSSYTSGTERFRITSSGNVGIGTSSPDAKLVVSKGGTTGAHGDSDLLVRDSSASGSTAQVQILGGNAAYSNLYFSDTDSYSVGGFQYNHSSNYLATRVNNAEAMRIDSNQNVSIPNGNLTVGGADVTIASNIIHSGDNNTYFGFPSNDTFRIVTAGNEALRVDSSGNLLVGKTSASYSTAGQEFRANGATILGRDGGEPLNLNRLNSDGGILSLRKDNTVVGIIGTASSGITFASGGSTERMRIDSSGNLLVGTTSVVVANSSSNVGTAIGSGLVESARAGVVAQLNRHTSDGSIVELQKDGASIGSIGTTLGRLYIGDGDVALRFADDLDFIAPWNATSNASRTGAISLGNSGNKFADLHLSGTANVGSLDVNGAAKFNSNSAEGLQLGGDNANSTHIGNIKNVGGKLAVESAVNRSLTLRSYASGSSTYDSLICDTSQNVSVNNGNLYINAANAGDATTGIKLLNSGTASLTKNGGVSLQLNRIDTGPTAIFMNNTSTVGSISVTSSATAYNTSSDYRLKEDWQPLSGATDRLKELKPVNFAWKADGSRVDGFLAHEAQEVVPESVTGSKDGMMTEEYQVSPATGDIYTPEVVAVEGVEAVEYVAPQDEVLDEDGNVVTEAVEGVEAVEAVEAVEGVAEVIHSANAERPSELEDGQLWRETTAQVMGEREVPDYQGIDQSKLVPLLVATIQELEARITQLENN